MRLKHYQSLDSASNHPAIIGSRIHIKRLLAIGMVLLVLAAAGLLYLFVWLPSRSETVPQPPAGPKQLLVPAVMEGD
ncbi:MAG TPA: hypothetical protein VK963_04205 [Candidatus Saccharimonadales bacterium]|nr:hypothetical protein [Candidatus Saccharimonadales bacterium]